jgi:hypothetical protein
MAAHELRQLLPGDGWYARFQGESGEEFYCRLVGWALLDSGQVVGVDVDEHGVLELLVPGAFGNFLGYHHDLGTMRLRGNPGSRAA